MQLKKVKDGNETSYNIEECLDKIIGINGTASDINQKLEKIEEKYTAAEKAKVNAIPNDPKYTDTVYDDTAIKNKINDVEGKLNGSGSVTFSNLTTTGLTTNGEVEIYGATPHIDFHYDNSTEDKTSRIIETASGKIDILATNGLFNNGKRVALKSDLATSNITLSVNDNRLKDFSYTAKYVPVIPAVFVRIYGVVNVDMNAGYDYDIVNIGSNSPNYQTALSIKSAKNVSAVAKNSGVISIRPLEAGIRTYAVYIAGFWFV